MLWFNKKKDKDNGENENKPVFLRTANSNYEFDIIKSVLEDNSVPYVTRDYGASGYLKIKTSAMHGCTDFLVSKDDYEKAKNLMEAIFEGNDDEH